jgi:folate-binding protein YgfZ
MQREWKAELIEAGGLVEDFALADYGDRRAEVLAAAHGTVWSPLTHMGILRATGADAAAFLHGQLSNDILNLGATSQLAAYCTAQGRMITLFRVVPHEGAFLLLLPAALQAAVQKRLTMYILRAQVKLAPAADWALIGLSGPHAPQALAAAGLPAPTAPEAATSGDITVAAIPGRAPRYLLMGPEAALRVLPSRLPEVTRVGARAWAWLDIQAGLPVIGLETSEAFVPQMMNLDLLGGINFRKGCYPGQEIVARTHYLGRLKQRMYLASLPADAPLPPPGATLQAPNLPGQPAGTVIDAQIGPDGAIDLLAVIQISSHDAGAVLWQDIALSFRDLPYPLAASC